MCALLNFDSWVGEPERGITGWIWLEPVGTGWSSMECAGITFCVLYSVLTAGLWSQSRIKQARSGWNRLDLVETGWIWLEPIKSGWNRLEPDGAEWRVLESPYVCFILLYFILVVVFGAGVVWSLF